MIRLNISDIQKIQSVLDKAWEDIDIESKNFDFDEILKCVKLMAFRLSKTFEGATFYIQYKGDKIFDVLIKSPFIEGKYIYIADPFSLQLQQERRI